MTEDLKEVFFKLIYRMDHDERANRILKIIQEYVSARKYPLRGYILGVLMHTTTWVRQWGGNETLK